MDQFIGYRVERLEAGDGRTYARTGTNTDSIAHWNPQRLAPGDTVVVEYTVYLPDGTQGDRATEFGI